MTEQKRQVSTRALYQRINRRLRKENKQLCTARFWRDGNREYENSDLGRYYVLDVYRNMIVVTHVRLGAYTGELGLLQPEEQPTE